MNPNTKSNIEMLIVEDFDRWLKLNSEMGISQILNALDGADDNSSCIRVFTCNNSELIKVITTSLSRFSATYYLGIPNREAVSAKIYSPTHVFMI